jgi:hypothetical protein
MLLMPYHHVEKTVIVTLMGARSSHVQVHYLETLHALSGRVAGTMVPDAEELKVHAKLHPKLPARDANNPPKYSAAHFYAALHVQAAVRGFLRRHALREVGEAPRLLRQQLSHQLGFRLPQSRFSGTGTGILEDVREGRHASVSSSGGAAEGSSIAGTSVSCQ